LAIGLAGMCHSGHGRTKGNSLGLPDFSEP